MIKIVIILIVIGVALWLINAYIPMDDKIKKVLNIFIVIATVVWLIDITGVLNYLNI